MAAANMDDTELVGVLSLRLKERVDLQAEKSKLEYELSRYQAAAVANKQLIDKLRQKAFWRNDMEIVALIDKERVDVGV